MNWLQLVFVLCCLFVGSFAFALFTQPHAVDVREALIFAAQYTVAVVVVTASIVGAAAAYLWLGEVK